VQSGSSNIRGKRYSRKGGAKENINRDEWVYPLGGYAERRLGGVVNRLIKSKQKGSLHACKFLGSHGSQRGGLTYLSGGEERGRGEKCCA